VAVVEVDVPAKLAPDDRQDRWVVDQGEKRVVAPDPSQHVHPAAGVDAPSIALLGVDTIDRSLELVGFGGRQGARSVKQPNGAELGALVGAHREWPFDRGSRHTRSTSPGDRQVHHRRRAPKIDFVG
jgi:hypothetical protein